jgi:Xaa-Pro aminopeptidase
MLGPTFQPTADSEMKRRHDAILAAMAEKSVDAIVMYNYGDMVAGIFKYVTDTSHAYPLTALLCAEGIALFRHGVDTPYSANIPFESKGKRLPVRKWTCPFLPGITYLSNRYAEAMTYFIKSRGFKRIGWAGFNFIPANIYKYLIEHNPNVEFVDFTSEIDDIRLVKSEWEIERFMRCVDLHDRLIMACRAMIRPYITTHMLNLEIMDTAAHLGAVEFNTRLITHWRDDVVIDHNSQILPGDYVWVLVEVAGVGGEWAECARLFRLGAEPEKKYIEVSNNLLGMQDAVAAACKPGAIPEDIFHLHNKMMIECGYNPERRICIHGQTYDIVDLPLFTDGDKKPLKENMFFTIHPTYFSNTNCDFNDGPCFNYTDNYLVEKDGSRILSKTPREIITIGI